MIFGNKKQKGKRTFREYDGQKVKAVKTRGGAKRTKKAHYFSRFMFYFLMLVFWGTAAYLVFFSGFLIVSGIGIQGNEIVKAGDIQKIIDSRLEGKYFNLLEKNNLVFLRRVSVENELLEKYKIISQVDIQKDFPNGLKISIVERKPQLIFDSGGRKWAIDEKGEIFDEAEGDFSYLGIGNLPVFFEESNKGFSSGDLAMDEKYIFFISDFRRRVENEIGIEFENEIRASSISSGDMRMKTREGWIILLDENLGSVKEKEMLQAVLSNKIEKEKRPDLEYIDLRISNKVFYKFKGDVPEENAEEKSESAVPAIPTVDTAKKDKDSKKKN